MKYTIEYLCGEYRPCLVKDRKALFHRWEEKAQILSSSEPIKFTVGIIEYENGVVTECYPYEIKFCDNKFREFAFENLTT